MIYAILDSEGKCINRTVWDGVSPWSPPEGCTAVADPDNLHPLVSPVVETVAVTVEEEDPLASLTLEQKQALVALLQGS